MPNAPSNFGRFVEAGRVVLLNKGPDAGKIAVVAEIIDHNRGIIDGPSTGVARQVYSYRHLTLTSFIVPKFPRGAGSAAVKRKFDASGIAEKWATSSWAKKREVKQKRGSLNDFDRFQIMLLKKSRRDVVRKSLKKSKA